MSNFIQRTLSGAVYVAVVVATVLYSESLLTGLMAVITLQAIREFCTLMKMDKLPTIMMSIAGVTLFLTQSVIGMQHQAMLMAVYGILLIATLVAELFRKAENPIANWGMILISQAMIALPFSLMLDILHSSDWSLSRFVLLAIFVCIWVNDSGAYCVGSLIGKHKMFPRVSPGKSWEGLVGGVVFSLVAGGVFAWFIPGIAVWRWMLIALTVSAFGNLGDLMESLLKRTIGVKDSGRFMPGHGGVLDRFDSLLLAVPAVWILQHFIY